MSHQRILEPDDWLPRLHEYDLSKWLTDRYYFDREAVHDVVDFASFCKGTIGSWKGKDYKFLDWQLYDLVVPVFGIKDKETGLRRFRNILFFVPRKNGKSGLMSVLNLYLTGFDGEPRAFVYGVAKNKEQASIVFAESGKMVEGSEWLSERFQVYWSQSNRKIVCHLNDGEYKVMSKDSKDKDGLNCHGECNDEIQSYDETTEQVVRLLRTSKSTRPEPLEFNFGTMGNITTGNPYWKKMLKRGELCLKNPDNDPRFYPLIYRAPKGADIFAKKTWLIANPSMPDIKRIDYMEEMAAEAKFSIIAMDEFMRLDLNIPTHAIKKWIPADKWELCGEDFDIELLRGRKCFVAADLSSTTDYSAVALFFPATEEDPVDRVWVKLWIPDERVKERARSEERDFETAKRLGHIEATPGDVIDYNEIEDYILSIPDYFEMAKFAYDPHMAERFIQRLIEKGTDPKTTKDVERRKFWENLELIQFRQTAAMFSEPMKKFEVKVRKKELRHANNPILNWMLECTQVKTDSGNGVKPIKDDGDGSKIDGIVALLMALGISLIVDDGQSVDEHINSDDFTL